MADSLCKKILIVLLFLSPLAGSIPSQELDRSLAALRYRGHALFANAIATSDLLFDLLMAESVTLLCPTDSVLFALDMTQTLPFYIATLRLSAVPRRLSLTDLRFLPNGSSIPTLVPAHSLLVTRPSSDHAAAVDIDGVRILFPDVYTSTNIAVHVISAVLPFRYAATASSSISPVPLAPVSTNASTVSSPVSAPGGPSSSEVSPEVAVSPSSPAPVPSSPPVMNRPNLRPLLKRNPRVRAPAPAPGPWCFHGHSPTGSPMMSPHISPEMASAKVDRDPPKIAEFSLVRLASLLGMDGAKEQTKSEPFVMQTSEF